MKYTVLLEDSTVGSVEAGEVLVGQTATVTLNDENGVKIEKTGVVADILELEVI